MSNATLHIKFSHTIFIPIDVMSIFFFLIGERLFFEYRLLQKIKVLITKKLVASTSVKLERKFCVKNNVTYIQLSLICSCFVR